MLQKRVQCRRWSIPRFLMNISQAKCYSSEEYGTVLQKLVYQIGACHDTTGDRGFLTAAKSHQ
jgi:hypothetical protein